MMRRTLGAAALLFCGSAALAIPPDGTYHAECASDGTGAEGTAEARLTFPEICFDGACCTLANPTRLRLLDEQFLYDGACTDSDGSTFDARLFFGEGPTPRSIVIVLRGLGMTLSDCDAPEDEAADEDDLG